MNTKLGRFFTFIMKEKTRKIFAFAFYIFFIVWLIGIDLPLLLEIICCIATLFISSIVCSIYFIEWMDKMEEKNRGKLRKNIIQEIKKISKEILMFIPINLISFIILSFTAIGQPTNQTNIEQSFYESPIYISILAIIIGPIMEEFIFRFLPYRFINNKLLYIIVSTVIFAAMHVVDDPNPFYYIWFYMIDSWY